MRSRPVRMLGLTMAVVMAAGVISCGKSKVSRAFNENALPLVLVGTVEIDTARTEPDAWRARIAWTTSDADGVAGTVEYSVDPAGRDTSWSATSVSPIPFTFPVQARNAAGFLVPERRLVVLRARDDRGESGPRVVVPLRAGNEPPSVTVTDPTPVPGGTASVPGSFTIRWQASDPDGYPDSTPAALHALAIATNSPFYDLALRDPDSLLAIGARTDWAGWQDLAGSATSCQFQGFALGMIGFACVVAVDPAGAHTASIDARNSFRFSVDNDGPDLHVSSDAYDQTFRGAGTSFIIGPAYPAVAGFPLPIQWTASPTPGGTITSTRWVLDPADLDDETPRSGPGDLGHWSDPLPASASITLDPQGDHTLYLEARDTQGRTTRVKIPIVRLQPAFDREVLIVDDTRREPDQVATGGCLRPYTRPWPSAAELDTFLFARGGVPWRCVQDGSAPLSPPGLFAGFSFDTLGTRLGLADPADAVSLERLLHYRHVLWLTDLDAALFSEAQDQRVFPITALRSMSRPGKINALQTYVRAGGNLWLAGGGTASANLLPYDVRTNNGSAATYFTALAGELTPARMMANSAHLDQAIGAGRLTTNVTASPAARGGWSGHGPDGTLSAPDYSKLPARMRLRAPETDALPPTRTASQAGLYYPGTVELEFVPLPTRITEDLDPDPVSVRLESTLDTLMEAAPVPFLASPAPAMTYYHGRENGSVIFTGFSLWQWTRPDAQALIDFVLQDLWRLSRAGNPGVKGPALQARPGPARVVGPARGRAVGVRLDPPPGRH